MSRKRTYDAEPRPKNERALNKLRGVVGSKPEDVDLDGDPSGIGSESHKNQALKYWQGQSKAGKQKPFFPEESGHSNDLDDVRDLTRKKAYGESGKAWSENTGKLGDLDPQETDQPGWVGTWSPLVEGPGAAGPTRDENYPVQRPRTQSRQEERFKYCNPEFQEGAGDGDWTSLKWDPNV